MKLIRFTTGSSQSPSFGAVIRDQAVSFDMLQHKAGKHVLHLSDSRAYLANLPDTQRTAKEMLDWGVLHFVEFTADECFPLDRAQLLEPVEVAALFDFALTPRHVQNSA
jgi:hypothetical protein